MIPDYTDELKEFILEHKEESVYELSLALSKRKELPKEFILQQVNGLQKAEKKFPFLLKHPKYIFPAKLSVEQASSEEAAMYKSRLIEHCHTIADLSGGMGIDSYFLSKKCQQLYYIERKGELVELANKNFKTLSADNIKVIFQDAENFIATSDEKMDLIYLDPDRRKDSQRLIKIADCDPNVPEILDQLFNCSNSLLIKYSPMLDIRSALSDLKWVKEVHILSIGNECKELLFLLEKDFLKEPKIICSEISTQGIREFTFTLSEEMGAQASLSEPLDYLYEANASILKSGAFNLIADRYALGKLAINTHLYTANTVVEDFPGRRLKILKISSKASELSTKANIVNRNSGLSVDQIKKKYKIQEGGDEFIYACRLESGKRIFILAKRLD